MKVSGLISTTEPRQTKRMEQMDVTDEDEEQSVPSLLEYMPPIVLLEIFRYVDWNDLCQLAQTCKKFREICAAATLWLALRTLDFRRCGIPDERKILRVLERTPNAETILLGDVITVDYSRPDHRDIEDEEDEREEGRREEQPRAADKFVLNILRACPRLKHIDLDMHGITDRTVEAVCAKCMSLQKFAVHDNGNVSQRAIRDLVSLNSSLTQLWIEGCEGVNFPVIKHTEAGKSLNLTKVSLNGLIVLPDKVQTLLESCPALTHLDLSGSAHLDRLAPSPQQNQRPARGLDNLVDLTLVGCEDLLSVALPYCPNLQVLNVSHCYRLTELTGSCSQLRALVSSSCENLEKLELVSSGLHSLCLTDMAYLDTLQIGSPVLRSLEISNCSRLTAAQVVGSVPEPATLTSLNIRGCKGIAPEEVDSTILTQFTNLKKLQYGGHSWNKVQLKSDQLTDFEYSQCINTSGIQLNMSSLQNLRLYDCRDFTEQDIVDSLLYGKQINRMQGLDNLIDTSIKDTPFANNTGTPSLRTLQLHKLPGLHGEVLSHWMVHLSQLTTVELVFCTFLSHLRVCEWRQLESLKIESCNRLNSLAVSQVPNLTSLVVRWCSMVQDLSVVGENITSLETTGTNFANINITCDKLRRLQLAGVCTQTLHTAKLSCPLLEELSIEKCDRLSDETFSRLLQTSPRLKSVCLLGSFSIKQLQLPTNIKVCSLTGLRALRQVSLDTPINVNHLTLNNLPKLVPAERQVLLGRCESSLKVLEVRAIPGETTLTLALPNLQLLTLDQGIHLQTLEIKCPKLQYLRIQGCPWLSQLTLHLASLSQVQVYHSMPLMALRQLYLHCPVVTFLPAMLQYYCPNLERLNLHGSSLKAAQLHRLGQCLPRLVNVNLHGCTVNDLQPQGTSLLIDSSEINRRDEQGLQVTFCSV